MKKIYYIKCKKNIKIKKPKISNILDKILLFYIICDNCDKLKNLKYHIFLIKQKVLILFVTSVAIMIFTEKIFTEEEPIEKLSNTCRNKLLYNYF